MIQVTIQLETLRCISQADITVDPNGTVRSGGGASEPYLWVAFFFFDFRAGRKTISMLRAHATIDSHWSNRIVPVGQGRMSFDAKAADVLWIG